MWARFISLTTDALREILGYQDIFPWSYVKGYTNEQMGPVELLHKVDEGWV